MNRKYLYIGLFLIAAAVGFYFVFKAKKPQPEELAPETKPTIVT